MTALSGVAVVGAGPAGLMAAEAAVRAGVPVTLFDRMPSAGRKFLLAGRGGLNLTHSEGFDRLLSRYGAAEARMRPALERFPPAALRAWSAELGEPTFVGSSGRVFPQGFKASPLLRAWLRRLAAQGVDFRPRHHWQGWDDAGRLTFATPEGTVAVEPAATVLALGGASWPRLGADGGWVAPLTQAKVAVSPLRPANCGVLADWSATFRDRFEGQPLKSVALRVGAVTARGDVVVTRAGLEGGAVYALSALLREALAAQGEATLHLNLRPDLAPDAILARLAAPRGKQSLATFLRKSLKLAPVAIGLLHEAVRPAALAALAPADLAALVAAAPIRLTGVAPLARAISTAGGVAFAEIDDSYMLRRRPGTFVAGEMLDWEAPTGGYLLQACFATGVAAGEAAAHWARRPL